MYASCLTCMYWTPLGSNSSIRVTSKVLANHKLSELCLARWCSSYWSTVAAAQSRSWPILTVFPVRWNFLFNTRGLQGDHWTMSFNLRFNTTKPSSWKAISLQIARCLSYGKVSGKGDTYIAWSFHDQKSIETDCYWKENPVRILHLCCSYLHSIMDCMSSGKWCPSEWLGAYQGNERI